MGQRRGAGASGHIFCNLRALPQVIGIALIQFRLASPRLLPALHILGKLAMADVFLVALYIVVVKGIGLGRVETGWGLYLFSACVLAQIAIGFAYERKRAVARAT